MSGSRKPEFSELPSFGPSSDLRMTCSKAEIDCLDYVRYANNMLK